MHPAQAKADGVEGTVAVRYDVDGVWHQAQPLTRENGDLLLVVTDAVPEGGEFVIDWHGRLGRHGGGPVRGVVVGVVRGGAAARAAAKRVVPRPVRRARRPARADPRVRSDPREPESDPRGACAPSGPGRSTAVPWVRAPPRAPP